MIAKHFTFSPQKLRARHCAYRAFKMFSLEYPD